MADHTPEDLSREIDRLWARVSASPLEASSASSIPMSESIGAAAGGEAAWETVSILKRQQRRSEDTWRQTLEAREESLRTLRARLQSAENELALLRGRAESEDERSFALALDVQQKLDAARRALELAQSGRDEERRALEESLQALRERFSAEAARARAAEQRWQAREQQYLLDLKGLQAQAAAREQDASASDKAARAHQAGLAEAKNALEKTLSELLLERKERERAHGEREAALKKVDELQRHVDELSRIWDEERAQWRELWDRERAGWESRRAELATWEENLRREREAWHAELQAKEKAHLELSDDLAVRMRETSKTAEKMTEMMSGFETRSAEEIEKAAADRARAAEGIVYAASHARARNKRLQAWAAGALAAAVLAAAAGPAWRSVSRWRYASESAAPAPTANPSALAFDGSLLWVADWGGRLVAVDPADPRRVVRQAAPAPGGPYRPTALAAGGGSLWTLDAAQARLLRHSGAAPEKILSARPSPGPAPTALAFDGETVWSYDAVGRALTRHGGDDAPAQSYALPDDTVPNAMAWADGRLWVHDAKGRRLVAYELSNGKMARTAVQPEPEAGVIGLAVFGEPGARRLCALLGPSGPRAQPEIATYRVKRILPFAHF